jgi:hypothetical protein
VCQQVFPAVEMRMYRLGGYTCCDTAVIVCQQVFPAVEMRMYRLGGEAMSPDARCGQFFFFRLWTSGMYYWD